MTNYKVSNTTKALTLAFDKTATVQEKMSHPRRYFVAAGETLKQIEECIADVATVDQRRDALLRRLGAKSLTLGNMFRFDFDPADVVPLSGTEMSEDFDEGRRDKVSRICAKVKTIPHFIVVNHENPSHAFFYPDISTPMGDHINEECRALLFMETPALRFSKWVQKLRLPSPQYAAGQLPVVEAVQIGDQWIVSVPVKTDGDTESWPVPPDSLPLTVSEYFALLEKNKHLNEMPKL